MKKLLPFLIVGALIAGFWLLISRYLTLAEAQGLARNLAEFTETHRAAVFSALALSQAVGMVFSLPTKAILTLLSGALLGPVWGSAASLIGVLAGTSLLFFGSRRFFRDWVKRKLGKRFAPIEERLNRRPVRAVAGLRLFITLPYGPITLAAALSAVRYRDFLIGSAIGDLPVIVVYTIAGKQLLQLTAMSEAVSPWTAAALVGVGLFFVVTATLGRGRAPDATAG